ncbi:MAG: hypothetical protein WC412_04515, partial [Candidatus Omnitrophota bacterium]
MVYTSEAQIFDGETVAQENGKIVIKNPEFFRRKAVDDLVDTIILSDSAHMKRVCYWVTCNAGL